MRHSGLGAAILEGSWLALALAGHLVEVGVPVLISADICLRLIRMRHLRIDCSANLAEEILRDRDTDETLVKGHLYIRLLVADDAHKLLLEGPLVISDPAISQLVERR